LSQREAAESAGISKHQQVQAVRVANVPAATFEAAVESDKPPTVTALADMGTKSRPKPDPNVSRSKSGIAILNGPIPHDVVEVARCAKFMREKDPKMLWQSLHEQVRPDFLKDLEDIAAWIDRFLDYRKSTFS
jgi:hypothetical protein